MHSFKILFPPSLQSTEKNRLAYCSQLTFLIWVVTTLKIPSTVHSHNSIIVPVIFCLLFVCFLLVRFLFSVFFLVCFVSFLFFLFSFGFCLFCFCSKNNRFCKAYKSKFNTRFANCPSKLQFYFGYICETLSAEKLSDTLLKLCSKWCKIA